MDLDLFALDRQPLLGLGDFHGWRRHGPLTQVAAGLDLREITLDHLGQRLPAYACLLDPFPECRLIVALLAAEPEKQRFSQRNDDEGPEQRGDGEAAQQPAPFLGVNRRH